VAILLGLGFVFLALQVGIKLMRRQQACGNYFLELWRVWKIGPLAAIDFPTNTPIAQRPKQPHPDREGRDR
jgi:hypothetical protein